jgi:hypothetical protein
MVTFLNGITGSAVSPISRTFSFLDHVFLRVKNTNKWTASPPA